MEGEKSTEIGAQPKKKTPTAEQYLHALFLCAAWIPEDYRRLAAGAQTETLKELYLCACDGVDPGDCSVALAHAKPVEELKSLRLQKIGESGAGCGTGTAAKVQGQPQQEARRNAKEENGLDALFMQAAPPGAGAAAVTAPGTRKPAARRKFHFGRDQRWDTGHITAYITKLAGQGYQKDQLNFVLDCFEIGMSEAQVAKIIAPGLPVAVMSRLRDMELRKGGKQDG